MSTDSNLKTCDLCCHDPAAWVISECGHLSCLTCAARLRILCEQKECPVCRLELDQVVVVDTPKPYSSVVSTMGLRMDHKYGLLFEKPHLYSIYRSLRDHRCTRCPEGPTFRSFSQLRDHHRRAHDLVYCDICVENLKLFPSEFKLYTRQELTRHRREGDPGETSYRGHPMCRFCDERYLDNDTLHSHLRKHHFWCHFCESDGKQEFYDDYPLLRQHFKTEHFLCVEGPCRHEKLTSVFRTKIDLQAHRASQHTKGLSKAEVKQLRQLQVGFTFDRGDAGEGRGAGVGRYGSDDGFVQARGRHSNLRGQRGRGAQIREREELELASALSSSLHSSEKQPQRSSPKIDRKPSKKPEQKKLGSAVTQSTVDRPPPPPPSVQQDLQRDGVGLKNSYFQDERQKKSRPPGFETVNIPAIGVSTGSSGGEDEWPNLTPFTDIKLGTSARQPAADNIGESMPPHITQMNQQGLNPPKLPLLQTPYMGTGQAVSVPCNPPPGFAYGAPPCSNETSAVRSTRNIKALEGEVIERVRRALNYDRSKFTQFMTISGWYRNSEVTVHEYASQCYLLFGETWYEIGPQLSQVLPVKSKRKELMSVFSSAGTVLGLKSTLCADPQSVWQQAKNESSAAALNEAEYPSLSAAAKLPDPSKGPQLWNARVSAW